PTATPSGHATSGPPDTVVSSRRAGPRSSRRWRCPPSSSQRCSTRTSSGSGRCPRSAAPSARSRTPPTIRRSRSRPQEAPPESVTANPRRPSGSPPYWPTGTQILWRSGDGPLATGSPIAEDGGQPQPRFAEPVTVVRDDADGLVAWLPTGTPVLRVGRADGLGK